MKKRLLLADDSVTIQKVVQITFSHDDYDLTVVDNGDMAYEKARSQRPDLILADVFMPGKNGYELCAAVKNDPALATVPVLLLTGTFEPFDEAKARSVGANRWIAKPFESQALISCVEELLALAAQTPTVAPPVSAPTPAPAPVEVLEVLPPEVSADLPDDIWGTDFAAEGAVSGDDFPVAEPFAATSQDDLWDVSGFETETPVAAAAAADEDLWGSFEPTPSVTPPSPPPAVAIEPDSWGSDDFSSDFSAAAPDVSDAFDGGVPDLPLTEDVEILEEIDFLEPIMDSSPDIVSADSFATDDFPLEEESVQLAEVEDSSALTASASPPPVVEVAPSVVATPVTALPATDVATLSDAQLDLLADRVAGLVVSRLSGTLLEKIAWEVVPDLAETMIKEELRKIRASVTAD